MMRKMATPSRGLITSQETIIYSGHRRRSSSIFIFCERKSPPWIIGRAKISKCSRANFRIAIFCAVLLLSLFLPPSERKIGDEWDGDDRGTEPYCVRVASLAGFCCFEKCGVDAFPIRKIFMKSTAVANDQLYLMHLETDSKDKFAKIYLYR